MQTFTIAGRGVCLLLNAHGFGVPGLLRLQLFKNIRVSKRKALRMPDDDLPVDLRRHALITQNQRGTA
jgi:hypothetical protein